MSLLKGLSRRVVVVDAPDPQLFEQAIFILRNDALTDRGVSADQVVTEACRIAREYTRSQGGRQGFLRSVPAPWYAAAGAGAVALAWVLSLLL